MKHRPLFFQRPLRILALAAVAALVAPRLLEAQQRIGSFVDGERSMYIEVTPLVEGAPFQFELRDVPSGSGMIHLLIGTVVKPVDLTSIDIPDFLGPELTTSAFVDIGNGSFGGTCPTGLAGATLYLQAAVATPTGTRLSSMVTTHVIAAGTDPGDIVTISFPLPLKTSQVLPSGVTGLAWSKGPVRVGIPLPIGQVFESNGIPQLSVTGGTPAAQFSTLSKWPGARPFQGLTWAE